MKTYLDNALMIDPKINQSHDWTMVWQAVHLLKEFIDSINYQINEVWKEVYNDLPEEHWASEAQVLFNEKWEGMGIEPKNFDKLVAFTLSFEDLKSGVDPNEVQCTRGGNSPSLNREDVKFILSLWD